MKEEFNQIYQSMYESYGSPPKDTRLMQAGVSIARLRDIIDSCARDLGVFERLRWDAKYFLLINLYQMVFLPTRYPQAPSVDISTGSLRSDVKRILKTAIERNLQDRYISSSAILSAAALSLESLEINSTVIWG